MQPNRQLKIMGQSVEMSRLVPVEVYSDSMEPTHSAMDIVIVDSEYTHPLGGGVFAFDRGIFTELGLGSNVFRCEPRGNGMIWISSDNKLYGHDHMAADDFKKHVIGRVVGSIKSRMLAVEQLKI